MCEEKPCAVCGKMLESAVGDWDSYQPWGGGEVNLVFAFGSRKFDGGGFQSSCFRGLICDECGEKMVGRMDG